MESMNWIFMLKEARRINPDFWFELSVWDGGVKKHKWYEEQGQSFTPQRYHGFVQFGMWLMRPKAVREFRASKETKAQWEPYFMEVVKAVDKLYKNQTLQRFWRKGELVKNEMDIHPYQIKVPDEYKDVHRWYLLIADVNPKGPWEPVEKNNPEIAVYSIAIKLGTIPNREWLVYSFSPVENKKNVKLDLPDYGTITIDSSPSGEFYRVKERDRIVKSIKC